MSHWSIAVHIDSVPWERISAQPAFHFVASEEGEEIKCHKHFRIHIILLYFNIPKFLTISVYGLAILIYGLAFWRRIRQTYYQILIIALALLTFAIAIDFLQLKNQGFASLSEGIPKLLSAVNLAGYFWDVCFQEISAQIKSQ